MPREVCGESWGANKLIRAIMVLIKHSSARFELQAKLRESSKDRKIVEDKLKYRKNQFHVYSTASFSIFVFTLSSGKVQLPAKLGFFNCLLN